MVQHCTLSGTLDRGGWKDELGGTSNIHEHCDGPSGGSDYIEAGVEAEDDPSSPIVRTAKFTCTDVHLRTRPPSGHKIHLDCKIDTMGMGSTPTLGVALYDSTTLIHSVTAVTVSTSRTTPQISISEANALKIGNYNNLRLWLTATLNDMSDAVIVYNVRLELPDVLADTQSAFALFTEL